MIKTETLINLCRGHAVKLCALIPIVAAVGYWYVGWVSFVACGALSISLAWLAMGDSISKLTRNKSKKAARPEETLTNMLADFYPQSSIPGTTAICFVLTFDDRTKLARHGPEAMEIVYKKIKTRVANVARSHDAIEVLSDGNIGVALAPMRHITVETTIQVAARFQAAATLPVEIGGLTLHPSVSVGFCVAGRETRETAEGLLEAAMIAADEATLNGPSAIRAYRREMGQRRTDLAELRLIIDKALEEGQIAPWFQPQICSDTCEITGFEALARWQHPKRGLIMPMDFLPAVFENGLSERLLDVILEGALKALKGWDEAGLNIPNVSVNFSLAELRNPKLAEKLQHQLERVKISPKRLYVEVLETVAAQSDDDIVTTNLAKIADMGCKIDLDDFGTGQAAIANIKRFSVHRIKIDRSFVKNVDSDPDQKRMVAAIQSLAERLGLEAVAEGVETAEEHSTLAQLGCAYLQGFGIARPMELAKTHEWIKQHRKDGVKLAQLEQKAF